MVSVRKLKQMEKNREQRAESTLEADLEVDSMTEMVRISPLSISYVVLIVMNNSHLPRRLQSTTAQQVNLNDPSHDLSRVVR